MSYLPVGWQCDVQIAYGRLGNAFGALGLVKEREASAGLLADVSDLSGFAQAEHVVSNSP